MFTQKDENLELDVQQELIGDRYQVIEALGKGGMGVVVKARHVKLGKLVAIKVLNAAMLVDETSRQRFEVEAKAAGNLSHPNLIAVFDYGFTKQGEPFIVMEYIEGQGLDSYIEQHEQLQFEDFVEIFAQIGKALQYVHNNNIIHRDLKPSNVMIHLIGDERYVKLLDFGLAKVFDDDGQPAQKLTATGASFGSPPYMSPEQCQGMKIDARADIYSFGCLMYECIAGDPPIIGDNALHTIFKQVTDLPKMLPYANESEHQLALLVDKCLQKNPGDRFKNVGELLAALSKLQRDSISPTNSKEQTGSQPSLQTGQQGGGFGAKWTKRTDDSTSVTPIPRQTDPQSVKSPVDYDSIGVRPAPPRMTRPDTPPPPAGSWEAPPPVAQPAGQAPAAGHKASSDDWVESATKKMFKMWRLFFAFSLVLGVVFYIGHGIYMYLVIVPQMSNLGRSFQPQNARTLKTLEQLNRLPGPP